MYCPLTRLAARRRQIVAEALLGADPQQKRRELRAVPQLGGVRRASAICRYVRTYKKSWQTDETVLRIHILPELGALALDEIKTEAISDLINGMREDGYASGTMNRVIVILRYIYNLARKWKVPGVTENPAAGLIAGPDVQRNRFLTEEEAEALVRSHPPRRKPDGRARDHAAAADRRAPQRDHFRQVGLHRLEEQDAAGAEVEVRTPARHRPQPVGDRVADGDAAHRRQSVYLPVAGHRTAVRLAVFSVGPHSQARGPR